MRPIILIVFIVLTCLSIMVIPSIEPGLDQQLSMAKDSHIVKYFQVRNIKHKIKFDDNNVNSSWLIYL